MTVRVIVTDSGRRYAFGIVTVSNEGLGTFSNMLFTSELVFVPHDSVQAKFRSRSKPPRELDASNTRSVQVL